MTAYHTILVDTDGSDRSYRVIDHAAELARASHARLLILCARHDIDAHTLGGTTPTDTILRTARHHATAHGATDITTHILAPPTLHALLHLAATTGTDLIVTGHPTATRCWPAGYPPCPSNSPATPTATSSSSTPRPTIHPTCHRTPQTGTRRLSRKPIGHRNTTIRGLPPSSQVFRRGVPRTVPLNPRYPEQFRVWVNRSASDTAVAPPMNKTSRSKPTNSSLSAFHATGSSSTPGSPAPPAATARASTTRSPQ
jgi:hypothetical protein